MRILGLVATAATAALLTTTAFAQEYTIRIQTHYAPETVSGKLAQSFIDDVEVMSSGGVDIEMFYSSSVVASVEAFDAAAIGHPRLRHDTAVPIRPARTRPSSSSATSWAATTRRGSSLRLALSRRRSGSGQRSFTTQYGMQLIGWWIYGQESLSSSKPIAGPADLKDWKFRSPPGLETEIFAELGASPDRDGFHRDLHRA